MATESPQGPPCGRTRKEAWWEEGAREAKSVASGSGLERSGDRTPRKAAGSAGSAVGTGIMAARRRGKRGNSVAEVGALRPSDGRSLVSIIPYRLQPASSGVSGGGAALHTSAAPAACSVASSSCLLPHQLRRLRAFFQLPLHAGKLATSM
jgi:hypothetical protein